MRNWIAAAVVLGLAASPARAGLFGRAQVSARWCAKPPAVNGDDSDWDESSAFEEDGLSVLAKNDAGDLYLLVTGRTREAREQLSGEARQDVALWFLAADGKTRTWGARLPFSRRSALTAALRDPAGLDPEPEFVQYRGIDISTAPLPGDVRDRLSAAGRRPVWELKIPLKRLAAGPEGAVAVDFVVDAPAGGAKRRPETDQPVWDASRYALSIRLAPAPVSPR